MSNTQEDKIRRMTVNLSPKLYEELELRAKKEVCTMTELTKKAFYIFMRYREIEDLGGKVKIHAPDGTVETLSVY